MTKIQRYFLFLAGSLCFIVPKNYAQTDSLRLTWEIDNTCQNDTLNARLKPSGFTEINGLQFSITWDTSNFQYIDYQLGQLTNAVVGDNQIAKGEISLIWSSPVRQALSLDALLNIQFLPKECGVYNDEINISNNPVRIRAATLLPNSRIERVPVAIKNTSFAIENCLTLRVTPDETVLCIGDSLQIEAICKNCEYDWSNGGNSAAITVYESDTYQVITNIEGSCVQADSVRIEFNPLPSLTLGNDTTICQEDYEIIAITDPQNTIRWNTEETTKAITINQAGAYIATVVDENSCLQKDTINVGLTPLVIAEISVEKDLLCPGDSLILIPLDGDFSTWRDTSATLRKEPEGLNAIVRPINTTTYFLTVGNECNIDTTSITIEVLTTNVTAGQDTCIGIGSTIQLNAQNALSYDWQPNDFPVSNKSIPNPSVQPEESIFYVLEAIDSNFCPVIDSVGIFVADNPILALDKINFLTPNGDGFNDMLEFDNLEKFGFNSLKIYNRQGTLVYQKLNYQNDEARWEGNFLNTNVQLPAGIYFYILQVAGEEIKQTLNLVR